VTSIVVVSVLDKIVELSHGGIKDSPGGAYKYGYLSPATAASRSREFRIATRSCLRCTTALEANASCVLTLVFLSRSSMNVKSVS
jgi:hypothetical protein